MSDTPESLSAPLSQGREAMKTQSSAGLVLQAHCLSVEAQPFVNFGSEERLRPIQERANQRLGLARDHARLYLNDVQPRIVRTVASIQEYFAVQQAVTQVLQTIDSREDAKSALRALQDRTQAFRDQSIGIRQSLQAVRDAFGDDSGAFRALQGDLNVILTADHGVLQAIAEQLDGIDGKIAGAAVGVALSGLAIIAGGIMFVVGAFASVVTGGAAVALCIAGGAVAATGVAGAVAASVSLSGLLNMKSDLTMRRAQIDAATTLVTGAAEGLGALSASARLAQEGAQGMANAWDFMDKHLESLYVNLDKGRTDLPLLRKIFLSAAEKSVGPILADADRIGAQMTGTPGYTNLARRPGDLVLVAAKAPEQLRLAA